MFHYIQAWLDRKQSHSNTSEFTGSVGRRCIGTRALPGRLLYWHALQLCLFQRNLWFLLCICWEVSFAVFGFWNNASVTCCFWAHVTWLGGSISATQSFDYCKWVHYCISRSRKGSDCLATSLCLSSLSRYMDKTIWFQALTIPSIISHPAEIWFQPKVTTIFKATGHMYGPVRIYGSGSTVIHKPFSVF